MTGVRRCTLVPRWLLLTMALVMVGEAVAGLLQVNADLSVTETVSAVELLFSAFAVSALVFMLGNLLDAAIDNAIARANRSDRRSGPRMIACGNLRVELYLCTIAFGLAWIGVSAMLTPAPPDVSRSLLNAVAGGLFINIDLWGLWLSVQNRRERKQLLRQPFWTLRGLSPRVILGLLRGDGLL
jgi:hypothetical protein